MSLPNNHIIKQQTIEMNFVVFDDAMGVQTQLAEIFYERIQPRMQVLFDELADAEHIISVDRLEIDCGMISARHWEEEWVDSVVFHLKQELSALPKRRIQPDQLNEQFFYFLETGNLPWNSIIKTISELEGMVLFDDLFLERLKEVLRSSSMAMKRLIQQFNGKFLKQLVEGILRHLDYQPSLQNMDYPILVDDRNKYALIFQLFATSKEETSPEKIDPSRKMEDPVEFKTTKNQAPTEIYIGNAGLVILHPFLPVLFEELRLVTEKKWISESAQHTAALITEFLVWGEEEFPEFNLALNKILCGIDPEILVEAEWVVDKEIKIASEELLIAVINHWKVLKNTGVNALRETFLRRNGKLTRQSGSWLLQVEQKGVDVLLNNLSWGIGTIKLPWMPEVLHVEWA